MTTVKPDFDKLSVEELFELDLSKACEEELHPHLMNIVRDERDLQTKYKFHEDGTVSALDGVTPVPEFFRIEMGDGATKPMSSIFVEEYRAIIKIIYSAPTAEELKASSYEEMPMPDLLRQRPCSIHYNDFMPKLRELMGADIGRIDTHIAGGGSYDSLVVIPAGRSSFVSYTHEFVSELRALLIHYRDLPKASVNHD